MGLRSAEVHELHDVIDDLVAPGNEKRPRLVTLEALGKEPERQTPAIPRHKPAPIPTTRAPRWSCCRPADLDEMAPVAPPIT